MRAILDTNMLIDGNFRQHGYTLAVSSLSYAELGFGIRVAPDPRVRAKRETELGLVKEFFGAGLPFDDAAAEAYETICGLVLSQGRKVRGRTIDLMIAATAVSVEAAVITKNPDDFRGLEGFVAVYEP